MWLYPSSGSFILLSSCHRLRTMTFCSINPLSYLSFSSYFPPIRFSSLNRLSSVLQDNPYSFNWNSSALKWNPPAGCSYWDYSSCSRLQLAPPHSRCYSAFESKDPSKIYFIDSHGFSLSLIAWLDFFKMIKLSIFGLI